MLENLLLPAIPGVQLRKVLADDQSITLVMRMMQPHALCPVCHQASERIHSRYDRRFSDVSWSGVPVRIRLRVRRFFCDNPACHRRIFVERLSPTIAPYARRTRHAESLLASLGLALGGKPGAPVARRFGMPTSPNTLLRILRRWPERPRPTPRVLGVDDWAWRKGHTYGTLLVDLERHQPIELLADRSADSLAHWLEVHPGVEIICRDRAGLYAEGAQRGAPSAIQVADRFHLLQNLRDTLQRTLERYPAHLRQVRLQAASANPTEVTSKEKLSSPIRATVPSPTPTASSADARVRLTASECRQQASRTRRAWRYAEVHRLHSDGLSRRAIASQLHLNRKTVTRFLKADVFPERAQPATKPSLLDRYVPYLRQQLVAGHDNGLALWRAIREQGYPGSRSLVSRWVAQHRSLVPPTRSEHARFQGRGSARALANRPPLLLGTPLSARRAAWLLLNRPEELTTAERAVLEQLSAIAPDVRVSHSLAQEFAQMCRERQVGELDSWLERAVTSNVIELKHFAEGLQRDYAAVRAALSLSYSSGQVEGQINKLKLLKRSMYGRASFDLLRRRMLATDMS